MKSASRNFFVLISLGTVLSLTCAVLIALAPAPMKPDATGSLMAVDAAPDLSAIFRTHKPAARDRWQYIYVHHSQTAGGNAATLARTGHLGDHFVIGNGDGAADGEIQMTWRWDQQSPAAPPPGVESLDPGCVSVCLIGDLDRTPPTRGQLRQTVGLIQTLQARFKIPSDRIVFVAAPNSAAAIGSRFPLSSVQSSLLP